MKLKSKCQVIHSLMSPVFVFLFIIGVEQNAYAMSDIIHYHTRWVRDTIAPEGHLIPDTIIINQPDNYPRGENFNTSASSKEVRKARRKANADKFWSKVLIGFFAILLKCGSCDCEDPW